VSGGEDQQEASKGALLGRAGICQEYEEGSTGLLTPCAQGKNQPLAHLVEDKRP
jgi:hypothetical protein